MKILIDADGCPVVDICIKSAKRHGIECLILCDTSHIFEREGAKTVTVSKGADSVDFRIVNLLERGDIVVTQDYGLAAMCLARGASALNQNGLIYTRQHRCASEFALRDEEDPHGGRQNKRSAETPPGAERGI